MKLYTTVCSTLFTILGDRCYIKVPFANWTNHLQGKASQSCPPPLFHKIGKLLCNNSETTALIGMKLSQFHLTDPFFNQN